MVKQAKATPASKDFGQQKMGYSQTAEIKIDRINLTDTGDIRSITIDKNSDPDFTIDDIAPRTPATVTPFNLALWQEWQHTQTNVVPLRSHAAYCRDVTLPTSPVYLIGGKTTIDGVTTYLTDVWRTTDGISWTKVSDDFTGTGAGRASAAIFDAGGIMYLVGGETADGVFTDEIWEIDRTTGAGTNVGNFPVSIGRPAYAQSGSAYCIMGGVLAGGGKSSSVYSSSDGTTWVEQEPVPGVPALPLGVSDAAGAYVTDGVNEYLVYCCGENAGPVLTRECYYASVADLTTWTLFANLPGAGGTERKGCAALAIGATLFLHGGTTNTDEDVTSTGPQNILYLTLDLGSTAWINTGGTSGYKRCFHGIANFSAIELTLFDGRGNWIAGFGP
jgi:hypothetical protein